LFLLVDGILFHLFFIPRKDFFVFVALTEPLDIHPREVRNGLGGGRVVDLQGLEPAEGAIHVGMLQEVLVKLLGVHRLHYAVAIADEDHDDVVGEERIHGDGAQLPMPVVALLGLLGVEVVAEGDGEVDFFRSLVGDDLLFCLDELGRLVELLLVLPRNFESLDLTLSNLFLKPQCQGIHLLLVLDVLGRVVLGRHDLRLGHLFDQPLVVLVNLFAGTGVKSFVCRLVHRHGGEVGRVEVTGCVHTSEDMTFHVDRIHSDDASEDRNRCP